MERDQPWPGVIIPAPPMARGILASNRPLVTPPDEALERVSRIARKAAELAAMDDSIDEPQAILGSSARGYRL